MITRPTVSEVLPLVNAVYHRHCAGCCLHILTDDGNVEDGHAKFCLKQAQEQGHADCLAAAGKLMLMSKTQRRKIYMTSEGRY